MTIHKSIVISLLIAANHMGNIYSSEPASPAKKMLSESKIAALYLSSSPTPSSPRTPSLSDSEGPKRSLSREEVEFNALKLCSIKEIARALDQKAKAKKAGNPAH